MTSTDSNTNISDIITAKKFDIERLKAAIFSSLDFINDDAFKTNIKDIVTVLTKDRNGDNKFDIEDIKLLSKDVFSIISLIKSIIFLLNTTPKFNTAKLDFNNIDDKVIDLLRQVLIYLFFVEVQKASGSKWNKDERQSMYDMIQLICEVIKSTNIVGTAVKKLSKMINFKSCGCGSKAEQKQIVYDKYANKVNEDLHLNITDIALKK